MEVVIRFNRMSRKERVEVMRCYGNLFTEVSEGSLRGDSGDSGDPERALRAQRDLTAKNAKYAKKNGGSDVESNS